MLLKALLTEPRTTALGNLQVFCPGGVIGGVLVIWDGTNAATVSVRKCSAPGDTIGNKIFTAVCKDTTLFRGPIQASEYVYLEVSGTGAQAQLYEWIE